jgi:hypothetical protein
VNQHGAVTQEPSRLIDGGIVYYPNPLIAILRRGPNGLNLRILKPASNTTDEKYYVSLEERNEEGRPLRFRFIGTAATNPDSSGEIVVPLDKPGCEQHTRIVVTNESHSWVGAANLDIPKTGVCSDTAEPVH